MGFSTKTEVREHVWETLEETGNARFPFPVKGRIPNFSGAERAADRLAEHPLFARAEILKINPDSPQRPVREAALRAGKTVIVPTPKLTEGFMRFSPEAIDDEDIRDATMISRWDQWAEYIELDELPGVDLIVTGCVAVTEEGKRAGKGHGYSDLEYAILGELGHPPAPVITTVHEHQVVDDFPVEDHDLHLAAIATPERTIDIDGPQRTPGEVDWDLLSDEDLEAMPVLERLRRRDP